MKKTVTQDQWDAIHHDYKGIAFNQDYPERIGKRTVFAGSIGLDGGTMLLTEGTHFVIGNNKNQPNEEI